MFEKLKKNWKELLASEPGNRFQVRYWRLRKKRSNRFRLKKFFRIFSGIIVIFIGMFFWLIPGSGWLIIIIGAGIIAGESLIVARCMDWAEIKIRVIIFKFNETWHSQNLIIKIIIILSFAILFILLISLSRSYLV